MKSINYISFILACVILVLSCREDSVVVTAEDTTIPDSENVKFQFQLNNELGEPISDAQIFINSEVYASDENGIVITQPYNISSLGLKSEITASGYESLVKLVNGPQDGIIKEKVILFKATYTTISTGAKGIIDGGGTLTLPSNLVASNGSSFTGEVTVKSKHLNPDNKDFLLSAPGNLLALNASNEYQQLASLGMYMIELYDASGEELNIPNGSSAIIEFPIADKNKDAIGSEIPLWYMDESTGIWKEDGVAKVEGDFMVAEVSHFTWWNCDLPYDFAVICLVFLDVDGEVLVGLEVGFSVNGVGFGVTTTDANGSILAKIPIGESVDLTYFLDGVEIGTQTISPFDENVRKDIVNTNLSFSSIFGVGLDCDMNPLVNGYCYYISENGLTSIPLTSDANFNYLTPDVEHKLILTDMDNDKIAQIEVSEISQTDDLDLGDITVCDQENLTKASGHILIDTDGDNIGDTPLPDAVLRFMYSQGTYKILTTDINGYYEVNVLPEIEYFIFMTTFGYVPIAIGDKTPEGNIEDEGFLIGDTDGRVIVSQDEHDTDNDILVIEDGEGTISGSAFGDTNNDGVGDIALEWLTLKFHNNNGNSSSDVPGSIVQADGSFSFESNAGYKNLAPAPSFFANDYLVDWDTSPDPDGDDSVLGSNGTIPIILRNGEIDANNEFVMNLSSRINLLCRVMEDTDFDNEGDTPLRNMKIIIKKRNNENVVGTRFTNSMGMISYISYSSSDNVELTVEIENTEYEIINIFDMSPDGDPFIINGDITKMEKNLDIKEWDAGNVFVVRKI